MKALVLKGAEALALDEIERPGCIPGETRLKVEIAGIGGSEYQGFANPGMRPIPSVMGHGFAGTTPDNKRVAVFPLTSCGVCDDCAQNLPQLCEHWQMIGVQRAGGMAEYVAVPDSALVPLPETMSWEQATFIEPFANAVNAWERSGFKPGERVAIIGAGGLGLGLTACAAQAGCDQIDIMDHSATRQQAAIALGATRTGLSLEGHYDRVFDTVGSELARNMALQLTQTNGTCVVMGFNQPEQTLHFSQLIRRQQRLVGAFAFSRQQFEMAIPLASLCPAEWVRNLTFEDVVFQLRAFLEGDFTTVKAALRPQKND
ncbi:zinc-dependent alcohol dehydrogenase [Marinobacter sp. 1Y8]